MMKNRMNLWRSTTGLFLFLSCFAFGQESKRVLFLGNSYTYYNNLPQLLADMALSAGDTLVFDSNTPGGYTLQGHSTNATSLQKIAQGNWDYVVLQEQSQLPSFPINQVQSDCFPYAAFLDSLINDANSCTQTMFYMTWGRENGDASNCATWPPVCTYQGMDSLLRLRYDQMAVDNEAELSPVGALWRYLRDSIGGVQLYDADGSHPSLAGSYAAACSFYATIFRKDPTLITFDGGLSPIDALTIRNAAKLIVYDSLLTWHVGEFDPNPIASFTIGVSFQTGLFTNTSTNASSYLWDFGDGNTSTSTQNIVYNVYSYCDSFIVSLTASYCNYSNTFIDTIRLMNFGSPPCGVGLSELSKLTPNQISPNPVNNLLQIKLEKISRCTLVDALGKERELILTKVSDGYQVDMSFFASGLYWLKLESEGQTYGARVMKE